MCPHPVLEMGNIHVTMYGIMIALGMLACFFVLFEYAKRTNICNRYVDFAFYTGIVAIVIGFIGAAVWQATFNYIDDLKTNPETAKFDLGSGITAIGGLVTGALTYVVAAIIFRKKYPFFLTKTVTIAPCCMVIAHAFGRIGCFCAGCCYGKEVSGFWSFLGVKFPNVAGGLRYPTQLFESAFLFALFAVMSYLVLKKKFKYNLVVYLASYGIWRFLIEFLRDDPRGAFVPGLSPSQMQSLILVAIAIPVFFLLRYYNKKLAVYESANGPVADHSIEDSEEIENKERKKAEKRAAQLRLEEEKENALRNDGENAVEQNSHEKNNLSENEGIPQNNEVTKNEEEKNNGEKTDN